MAPPPCTAVAIHRGAIPACWPCVCRIFHPNVSTSGELCVNVLMKDWTADTGALFGAQLGRVKGSQRMEGEHGWVL